MTLLPVNCSTIFWSNGGYNVCAAADGLRALEILRSEDVPTLAILD